MMLRLYWLSDFTHELSAKLRRIHLSSVTVKHGPKLAVHVYKPVVVLCVII